MLLKNKSHFHINKEKLIDRNNELYTYKLYRYINCKIQRTKEGSSSHYILK